MTVIAYTGPTVSPEVPWEVRRHLQLFYDKLANHTQAFSLLNQKIASVQTGTSTTVVEGGGGSSTPVTSTSVLTVNNQSGVTSYSTVSGDNGALIVFSDASPIAVTLAVQTPPWGCFIANQGTGTATLTPAANGALTPTISYAGHSGAANLPLLGGYCAIIAFDGANWFAWTEPIVPVTFGAVAHDFLTAYDATTGAFTAAQPAFTDISGTATAAQVPALSALSGAITASQLPADVPVVSFGTGAPVGTSTEGYQYFDTTGTPYHGYVYHSGAWVQFS